ncbi:MAG: hypothetical protein ACRC6E_09415, partial [Fusobacteriaceae bacterium]
LQNCNIFIDTLKFCNGIFENKSIVLSKEINFMKSLIFKNLSLVISENYFFENFINKIILADHHKNNIYICDLEFLKFNLSQYDISKCVQLFFVLRKLYKNIQFSNIIFLYFLSSFEQNSKKSVDVLAIFDNIPSLFFPIIKKNFLLKENLNILDFVKISELNEYLSKKDIAGVVTFENLNFHTEYPFIKSYSLPIS